MKKFTYLCTRILNRISTILLTLLNFTYISMTEQQRIEALMQDQGLRAKDFAQQVGISGATMTNITNGRNKPSLEVMQKILNRFRMVSADWLILGVGTMYQKKNDSQGDILPENASQSTELQPDTSSLVVTPILSSQKSSHTQETHNPPVSTFQPVSNAQSRTIRKIVVFYSDGTFEELAN